MAAKQILCVDDDSFYREFYSTIFSTKGYDVATAESLSEGLEKAKKLQPALIVLDIMMPESDGMMDGYGLLRELRASDDTKDVPVIMISALDQTGDLDRALEMGATTYIPKQNLTPERLLEMAKKIER